jgi:hypothetical protein
MSLVDKLVVETNNHMTHSSCLPNLHMYRNPLCFLNVDSQSLKQYAELIDEFRI